MSSVSVIHSSLQYVFDLFFTTELMIKICFLNKELNEGQKLRLSLQLYEPSNQNLLVFVLVPGSHMVYMGQC